MLFRLLEINESSKYFKYIFCNEHTIQLTIKSKLPQNFVPYYLYDINLSLGEEYVPNPRMSDRIEYLGVVFKTTRNSIHVQSGSVHFLFPLAAYKSKPGTDVWIFVTEIKS